METGGNGINNPDDAGRGIGELWATIEQQGEQMNAIQEALHNLTLFFNANRNPTVNRNRAEGFARGRRTVETIGRAIRMPICEELHQKTSYLRCWI